MRNFILATALAATAAWGAFQAQPAQAADVRVSVGLGDVVFDAGIPYYRSNHEPIYVVYENNEPHYYRVVSRTTYTGTDVAPPPWAPAYGWRIRKHHRMWHGYYDVNGVWHWD